MTKLGKNLSMQRALRSTIVLLVVVATACGYEMAATATYEPPPATTPNDGLWLINGSRGIATILRLSPTQLLTGGTVTAATESNTASASLFALNSIAFDASGTMWIASAADSLLLAYPAALLGASGLRPARAVILPTNRSLSGPSGMAFDRKHRLWVENSLSGTLVRFDSTQLITSGRPTPTAIIEGLTNPMGIAFDASGGLWVADGQSSTVVRYSAAQLELSGRLAPDVVLRATAHSLASPVALAFDASGNLWVSNIGSGAMVEFSATQLAASGAPTPRVSLTSEPAFGLPVVLAFDAEQSLWVLDVSGRLGQFSKSDLREGGSKDPRVTVEIQDNSPLAGLAFFPKPRGLPLN
ncbi:MAG: SMP-30/gluconolactonase/LRE family protein [Gemmatimonadaceae bacterium]